MIMECEISARTQELIKKAYKSIIDNPERWDQLVYAQETPCGTQYCVAGWMMTHAGFSYNHQGWMRNGFKAYIAEFIGPIIDEIYGHRYWDAHGTYGTLFSSQPISIDELHAKIENLGIDLSEFAEQDDDVNEASFDARCDDAIKDFVAECAAAGDRMTERQVRGDVILMSLLKKIRDIGIEEGWDKASSSNVSVLEAQHLLKIEQRHSERLRGDLETQRSTTVEYIRQRDDLIATLRAEIREMRDKVALSPGRRLDAMQQALKERTKQARDAGQSARAAEAKLRDARERIEDLEGKVTHLQGTSPYWEQISRENQQLRIALASICQSTHDLLEGI